MRMKLKETDVWYVDTEEEAVEMIESEKAGQLQGGYTVVDSGYKIKVKKSKGEIIDQHYEVKISRSFDI